MKSYSREQSCQGTISWAKFRLKTLLMTAVSAAALAVVCAGQPALIPKQLGAFCPSGGELVSAERTSVISVAEQSQIRKSVQGFMALDAKARRSHGHPDGPQTYWEKRYTAEFDTAKDVPRDSVSYLAYVHTNTCATKDGAWAVILLDIVQMHGKKIEKIFDDGKSFLSPQAYWDAFSRLPMVLPDAMSSPKQPVLFTVLPMYRSGYGHWTIQQGKVPSLIKFDLALERSRADSQSKSARCDSVSPRDPGLCALINQRRQLINSNSRPAWSVLPDGVTTKSGQR